MKNYQDKGAEPIQRIKEAFKGKNLEAALRNVSKNNGIDISEDELMLGMGKENPNLAFKDIKEFSQLLKMEKKMLKFL